MPCRFLSLCFHLHRIIMRRMLTRRFHIRGLSRLMVALFAMQIVVGGLCLLTPEAHAMPQFVQTMDTNGNCAKPIHENQVSHDQDHSDACYHCDQPDELSNASQVSVTSVTLALPDVISLPTAPLFSSDATGLFSTRAPTGPPRSSSLLYTTSQRILI